MFIIFAQDSLKLQLERILFLETDSFCELNKFVNV